MTTPPLTPGERVTWLHEQRGGYGFVIPVPATVVKVTAKRVTLDAELRYGGTKRVSVKPENIRRESDIAKQESDMQSINLVDPAQSTVDETLVNGVTVIRATAAIVGGMDYDASRARFNPGELNITVSAYEALSNDAGAVTSLLDKFLAAEWDNVAHAEDRQANDKSVERGLGLVYDWPIVDGHELLIFSKIGEVTTVMLRSEY